MALGDLAHYGLAADRGFLSQRESDEVALPPDFDEIEAAGRLLPDLLTTGRVRHWLDRLPLPDVDGFLAHAGEAELIVAMVRYSFLTQAYVWGEPDPSHRLPANLAVPFVRIADTLGVPPVMNYSGYVLDNWLRIDKSQPIVFDNIAMHQHFAGGTDEAGFVLTHVAIEAAAGPALDLAVELTHAADARDALAAEAMLHDLATVWRAICGIFDRMTERCDPAFYFTRIRPYLNGWHDNPALPQGMVYEGVDRFAERPIAMRGQTGSQSSIVPAMDALFGVTHERDELRVFLEDLHRYRLPRHRAFIEDLAAASQLRAFARDTGGSLKAAFNAAIQAVAEFRTMHLRFAATYIAHQAPAGAGNDPNVGTGGTPFMKYLKKHRNETERQML
ncbi:indoleamine 2,3-dioxygenase [Hephaestia sp. GCM10023244]|uniref:indoleamine 2,3-dioxygenase n=1 Tax=unclassified Hephaestia TaxID=2631281 RepID=UPI0020772930|nr:indoleamine 2,3-dioxygenase [Hephaestia sp. MAHUQ-44]MCM8729557.1 indoleamine 2,3-dioxygenase [Hephaestia sp. MAHUQ-44]